MRGELFDVQQKLDRLQRSSEREYGLLAVRPPSPLGQAPVPCDRASACSGGAGQRAGVAMPMLDDLMGCDGPSCYTTVHYS